MLLQNVHLTEPSMSLQKYDNYIYCTPFKHYKNCDRIYVMDKGKIVEHGTHRELIAMGGKYAYLVKQQSLEENNTIMEGGDVA